MDDYFNEEEEMEILDYDDTIDLCSSVYTVETDEE